VLTRKALLEFLRAVEAKLDAPARLYLVGESSLVLEGWREWTDRVVYTVEPGGAEGLERGLAAAAAELGVEHLNESPAQVIPLQSGHLGRARPVEASDWDLRHRLQLYHYDPYGTAIRLIARGDEPDYRVVLEYLQRGWIDLDELDRLVADSLPGFSAETLAQDPAEFRRKYKGLRQMWLAATGPGDPAGLAAHREAGHHARF
jgi:hypothetical protein